MERKHNAGTTHEHIIQSRGAVQRVAGNVGFREVGFFGKGLAYTMHFEEIGR